MLNVYRNLLCSLVDLLIIDKCHSTVLVFVSALSKKLGKILPVKLAD